MSDRHDGAAASYPDGIEPFVAYGPTSGSSHAMGASRVADATPIDISTIASWLPRLGAVLWLDRGARRRGVRARIGAQGVFLLDHPSLDALARSCFATAHTQVTSHGPREWLAFQDAQDATIAKVFLLPDTDYLGWDEMIAALGLTSRIEESRSACPCAALVRNTIARASEHWRARLLTFHHRRLPWLESLDARAPLRLSLLGIELARTIAAAEGAHLSSPLHAA